MESQRTLAVKYENLVKKRYGGEDVRVHYRLSFGAERLISSGTKKEALST